eukprot:3123915-Ditylum_brightwellii.AAC.1
MLPWQKLFFCGHDSTLITTTEFDHEGFEWILDHFKGPYNHCMGLGKYDYAIQRKQEPKKCKPRLLDAKDCLGLILMWTRTRGPTWVLGVMFGITSSPMHHYLHFGRHVLLFVLPQEQ